jgi:diketogulonate reductase-like aldo/keto reductase
MHEIASSVSVFVFRYLIKMKSKESLGWLLLKDQVGRLPIHYAAFHGNLHVFREMLLYLNLNHDKIISNNLDPIIDDIDSFGCTCLMLACSRGHPKIAYVCLQFQANEYILDKNQRTCMEVAQTWKNVQVCDILQRKCIYINYDRLIPTLGFGTYKLGLDTESAVRCALLQGYRILDMAEFYGNEEQVGLAVHDVIKNSNEKITHKDLFLISKVWNSNISNGNTVEAVKQSLQRLKMEYIDLILIHWPCKGYLKAFGELLELKRRGIIKYVGVSNFFPEHLEKLYEMYGIYPDMNEIELSPFLYWENLIRYCAERNIGLIAYRSLGNEGFMKNKFNADLHHLTIMKIASMKNKMPSHILLRWGLQKGSVIIPKSKSPKRIEENMKLYDFILSKEEIQELDKLTLPEAEQEWMKNVFVKSCKIDVLI